MGANRERIEEAARVTDARQVDRLCDRFETCWRRGERPALEAFLDEAPTALRIVAFRELLMIDIECRKGAGETPAPQDYLARFSDLGDVIVEMLAEASHGISGSAESGDSTRPDSLGSGVRLSIRGTHPRPVIPGYEILDELGRGGMGVVFKARQVHVQRIVALKMILPESYPRAEGRVRFRTEVEAIARMQHPNIVQVYEVGECGGQPFFSLEFCAGGSLDKKLASTPLPVREAAALVETLARAIQALHQKGIVHRDLKPSNVLLTEEGTPKVSDFGLAKVLADAPVTMTGLVMGTPGYMAPEQAGGGGKEVGLACDVYALGAILYECLTGRPPFKAATPFETMRQVCEQEPVSPRSLNAQIPRDLEIICLKCLRKGPQQRYASALALAEDLRCFLTGAPIRARPPSALRLAVHAFRRYPTAVTTLAAVLVLAVTITAGAVWHSAQLSHVLENEQNAKRTAQQSEARANQIAYVSDLAVASKLVRTGNIHYLSDLLNLHLPIPGEEDRRDFAWFYARQFSHPRPPPSLQAQWQGAVYLAAFSKDNRFLLTAGTDDGGYLRVHEMSSGRYPVACPCQIAGRPSRGYTPLAVFCPDSLTLAVAGRSESRSVVRLIDVATGKETGLLRHPGTITYLGVTAEGRTAIAVGEGKVYRWDLRSQRMRGPTLDTDADAVVLAVSPDGKTLAVVRRTNPSLIRFWDLATAKVEREVKLDSEVESLTFSAAGNLLAVCQRNGEVLLFHTEGRRVVQFRSVGPHQFGVVAFAPDGRALAIGAGHEIRLWNLCDGTFVNRLQWQASPVSALAFSRDGQFLAVGTWDGMVHRLDATCPASHATPQSALRPYGVLAVSHDGSLLAIPDQDNSVKLVDAASGAVRHILPGSHGRLIDCVFSPDDHLLATAGLHDAEVRLWDKASGRASTIVRADLLDIRSLAFSPREMVLAGGDAGGTIFLWNARTGQRLARLAGHQAAIQSLAFSADGRVLASCDGTAHFRVWNLSDQASLPASLRAKIATSANSNVLAFAPAGRTLAIGQGGEVHLWEVPELGSPRSIGTPLSSSADATVTQLSFAPDGRNLLISYRGETDWRNRVYVRGLAAGWPQTFFHDVNLSPDRRAATWLPDGRVLVQTMSGEMQMHDLSRAAVCILPGQVPRKILSLIFNPDGRSLILGTDSPSGQIRTVTELAPLPFVAKRTTIQEDKVEWTDVADTIRVWNLSPSLTDGARLPNEPSLAAPGRLALSGNGRLLAAGGSDGSIRLWDFARRSPMTRLFLSDNAMHYAHMAETVFALRPGKPEYVHKSEGVVSLAFSPDHRWLAALGHKGTVSLWETESWRRHHLVVKPPQGAGWLGFSPESVLAVASGGSVRLVDPETQDVRQTLGAEDDSPILCGAFAPAGDILVTGTAAQTIGVWDTRKRSPVRTLSGHLSPVMAVAFHPDGRTLASGDRSGAVNLWNVLTWREVASLEGHRGEVGCLAFSPDGQTLASGAENGSRGGEVFLWEARRR